MTHLILPLLALLVAAATTSAAETAGFRSNAWAAPAIAFSVTVTNGTKNQLAGPVGFAVEDGGIGPVAAWSVTDSTAQQTVTCVAPLGTANATCGKRMFALSGTQWTVERPIFVRDGGVFISDALQLGSYDPATQLGNYTTTVVSRTNGGEAQVCRPNVGRGTVGATQSAGAAQGFFTTTSGNNQSLTAIALNGSSWGAQVWADQLGSLQGGAVHDVIVSGEYVYYIHNTTIYAFNATTGAALYHSTIPLSVTQLNALDLHQRPNTLLLYGARPDGLQFAGLSPGGQAFPWFYQWQGGSPPTAQNFQVVWMTETTAGRPSRSKPALAISVAGVPAGQSLLTVLDLSSGMTLFSTSRMLADVPNFPVHLGNNSFGYTYNGTWIVSTADTTGTILSSCGFGCAGAVAVHGFVETGDLRVGCALTGAAATVVAFNATSCAVAWEASLGAAASQTDVFAFESTSLSNMTAPEPFFAVADVTGVMYSFSFRATGQPTTTAAPTPVVTPAPSPADTEKSQGGAIAGGVIGCLLAVAVGGVIYHRLKRRSSYGSIDSDDLQGYQAVA